MRIPSAKTLKVAFQLLPENSPALSGPAGKMGIIRGSSPKDSPRRGDMGTRLFAEIFRLAKRAELGDRELGEPTFQIHRHYY